MIAGFAVLVNRAVSRLSLMFLAPLLLGSISSHAENAENGTSSDTKPPNILILFVDDFGINDVGIYGSEDVSTPNLDEFARQSVKFDRHYADTVCSPSRAALLTGRFPARSGYMPQGPGLSPQAMTLPRELRKVGYTTHQVGKWHIGHISPLAWPDAVGFDSWLGFFSQYLMKRPYKHPHTDALFGAPDYFDPWLSGIGREPRQYKGHVSDILAQHTIDLIEDLSGQDAPWFINHWFFLPHAPFLPAPRHARNHSDSELGRSLAMLSQLDELVGSILRTLKKTGQAKSTIVVVAGDNGGANVNRDNNAPYIGKKTQLNEGGLRTPLMIRWPGVFPKNKTVGETVSIVDIMPTLLVAAGRVLPGGLDGFDLANLVVNQEPLPPRSLFWEFRFYDEFIFSVLSRDGRWRVAGLASSGDAAASLYDLESDPTGGTNVLDESSDQASALVEEYRNWFREVHTLSLDYRATNKRGAAVVLGDDLQRAPGNGSISVAIGVESLVADTRSRSAKILDQPGVWKIKYNARNKMVTVRFGAYRLKAVLQETPRCQSIVVTGDFLRRSTNWKQNESRIQAKLYIDGVEIDSIDVLGKIRVADVLTNKTYIGTNADGGEVFPGVLTEPIFLNVVSSGANYISPTALHEAVCS